MKPTRRFFRSALLVFVCAVLTVCAASLRSGDIVDYVLASDITAYIDGVRIPACNIGGYLGIVAEDLVAYGFDVSYCDKTRTLSLVRTGGAVTGVPIPAAGGENAGSPVCPVLYSDIVTYLDGDPVESFNIDGRTVIYFSALDGYGSRIYDDGARLSIFLSQKTGRTLSQDPVTLTDLPQKIIHAGGSIGGYTGSNAKEAMDLSYAAGYRILEMDLLFSADGIPVCLHDWSRFYSNTLSDKPSTAAEFEEAKIFNLYTSMSMRRLADWLYEHPDVRIVTDVKDDNVGMLRYIADRYPDLVCRFLPQIYDRGEFAAVRALGYTDIIFTLYKLTDYAEKTDAPSIADFAKRVGLLAVTADKDLASEDFIAAFTSAGVPLYVHTVNRPEAQESCYAAGITGVYTDYTD
ncbi:MAG: hypothetical protein IJU41_02870 [Clostridia bacterium]|nr:hypothetical protein [Clostridia bacterium]